MARCKKCRNSLGLDDQFCSMCGAEATHQCEGDKFCKECGKPISEKKKRPGKVNLAGVLVLSTAVVSFLLLSGPDAEGSFSSTGGTMGDFTIVADRCGSGERQGFFGAFVTGDGPTKGGLKIIQDPMTDVWSVLVEIPGSCKAPDYEVCTVVPLPLDQCATRDVSVARTGNRFNSMYTVEGRLNLSCSLDDGGTVNASISFDDCA